MGEESLSYLALLILITTASPTMGANVGASISEFVAFLTFILLIYNFIAYGPHNNTSLL